MKYYATAITVAFDSNGKVVISNDSTLPRRLKQRLEEEIAIIVADYYDC